MTTLVIISHSEQIANGTKALLQQMAPDVNVVANGGVNGDIGGDLADAIEEVKQTTFNNK